MFNDTKTVGKWCNVCITVGDTIFQKKAVTQPGDSNGWSACLSLDMADDKEGQFLLDRMKERAAMTEAQTLYLPPEVRGGILLSGVLASEAVVVKGKRKEELNLETESKVMTDDKQEPVQATAVEAPKQETAVEVDEQTVDRVVLEKEKVLVSEEVAGDTSGGRAEDKGEQDLEIKGIREEIPRESLARDTKEDRSLQAVHNLGLHDREGYHLVEGLLFRTRMDMFGNPIEQLCMPASCRTKCLHTAHNNFGHQGRNKMLLLLRPHFYWPNMSRDC